MQNKSSSLRNRRRTISREFLVRLKLNPVPAYRLAQAAGVNPNTLSKLLHGCIPLRPEDERIAKIAEVLGMSPKDAFEEAEETVRQ